MDYFMEGHQCVRCGAWFREMTNLGSWECMYHPGKLDMDGDVPKWSCCGQKVLPERLTPTFLSASAYGLSRRTVQPVPRRASYTNGRRGLTRGTARVHADGCTPCDHLFPEMEQFTPQEFQEMDEEIICALNDARAIVSRPGFREEFWCEGVIKRSET